MVPEVSSVEQAGAFAVAILTIQDKLRTGELHYGDTIDLDEILPNLSEAEQDQICEERIKDYHGPSDRPNGLRYSFNFNWLPGQRRLVVYSPAVPRSTPS